MRRSSRSRSLLWPTGIRVRLTLWYLAIITLLFVVFSGIIARTLTNEATTQEEAVLASAADQLGATYDATSCSITVGDSWQSSKSLPLRSNDIAVLFDANGMPCKNTTNGMPQVYGPLTATGLVDLSRIVFEQVQLEPGGIDTWPLEVQTAPTGSVVTASYSVYVMRVGGTGTASRFLVVAGQFDPNQSLRSLAPALLIAGPLTLLVAAVGGYWLATRAMRPVRLITQTAREIGERDLDRRLNLRSCDELGELARTFDDMLDRLQAAVARQRQFTADASHELRTPLSIVDLEVTRVLGQSLSPEEYERVLAVVQSENAYMARLVGDLLTLARADAGQDMLRAEPLDLSDVAAEVVERMAPRARQAGLHLVAGALPELPVRGDRSSLTQALGNLVENAIKYTPGAGTRVELAAGRGIEAGREWAWVRVTDDGPGIASAHLPHLCERFYRVDAARARLGDESSGGGASDGSGLGLAIVDWAVQAQGGELRIRSAVGVGSVFELWLPLLDRPAHESPVYQFATRRRDHEPMGKHR